jgi:hypothetical protein
VATLYLFDAVANREWGPLDVDAPYAGEYVKFRGLTYEVVDVRVVKGRVTVVLRVTILKHPVVATWTEADVIPGKAKAASK